MAVKRRVIWTTDEEWDRIRQCAEARQMTVSLYIRGIALSNDYIAVQRVVQPLRTHTGRDGNPGAASDRFTSRPFSPAPKPKR